MCKSKRVVAAFLGGVLLGGGLHGVGAQSFSFTPTPLSTVRQFFGTAQVKVAFKGYGEGMYLVDYSRADGENPEVTLFPGTKDAWFPVISPDGKWMVYTTGTLGDEYTTSAMVPWLRSLETGQTYQIAPRGYVPRFVQDESGLKVLYATESQHIDVTTGKFDGKYGFEAGGVGKMVVATFNGGSFGYDTLWHGGVMLGGLSRDKRYLGHGEAKLNCFILDLQRSSQRPFALHCLDGGKPEQVCNTSISSSQYYTNTLLYFDFGGTAAALGGTWGLHKKLFIGRTDGAIVRHYDMPSEIRQYAVAEHPGSGQILKAEWNFPEWSNHPHFAVTTISVTRKWKINGKWMNVAPYIYIKNERLYGVDLKDSLYLELAMSKDTTTTAIANYLNPWIWIGEGAEQEQNGWMDGARYVPAAACVRDGITDDPFAPDTGTPITPPPPPPPAKEERDDGPCGKGAVGALLPPLFLKVWNRRKKARLNT